MKCMIEECEEHQTLVRYGPTGIRNVGWLCLEHAEGVKSASIDFRSAIFDAPTVLLHNSLFIARTSTDPRDVRDRGRFRRERKAYHDEMRAMRTG